MNDQQAGQQVAGQRHFIGENAPRGTAISYWLRNEATGDVKIAISDGTGRVVRTIDGTNKAGLNRVEWNLAPDAVAGAGGGRGGGGGGGGRGGGGGGAAAGAYSVKLTVGGKEYVKALQVLEDRWLNER